MLVVAGDRVEDRTIRTGIADEDTVEVRAGSPRANGSWPVPPLSCAMANRVRPVLETPAAPPAVAAVPAPRDTAEAGLP